MIVLAQQEARELSHDWIGTEHILLALLRKDDGVAAQVLVSNGLDLNRVRAQVIMLLHGYREERGLSAATVPAGDELMGRPASIASRLNAIELRLRQSPSG